MAATSGNEIVLLRPDVRKRHVCIRSVHFLHRADCTAAKTCSSSCKQTDAKMSEVQEEIMLDIKFLRENPEVVKQNIRNKFRIRNWGWWIR